MKYRVRRVVMALGLLILSYLCVSPVATPPTQVQTGPDFGNDP